MLISSYIIVKFNYNLSLLLKIIKNKDFLLKLKIYNYSFKIFF